MTDIAADTTTIAAVAVGGSATGEIETAGDKDWFAVELEAGRTYRFDLQGAPGGHGTLSDTFLRRILDAEGNKSIGDGQHRTYNDDFQGSRDSRVTFTATEAGTYYVEASGDRDETGTYTLTVTDVTPEPEAVKDAAPVPVAVADAAPVPEAVKDAAPVPEVVTDIAADTTTTAAVAVGGSATGEIETAGDKDWFAVELEAGRTYRFDLQGAPSGHGTLSDTFLRRILDAEGNKSTGDGQHRTYNDDFQGSGDSRVTFTATEAGTYYVEASGDRDETGTYTLTVTDVTPVPVAVADVTPVPVAVADVTPVPVAVADAAPVPEKQITRPPFGQAGPPSVSLFEGGFPDAQVFTDSDEEPLVSQQQRAGDDYAADILTTGRVAVGGSVTGVISAPPRGSTAADVDWFKVQLEAGKTYRIDLEGAPSSNGTLQDLRIRGVYDADGDKAPGTFATFDSARARGQDDELLFTPESGGSYYIAAASLVQAHTGTYRLSVTEIDTSEADRAEFQSRSSSATTVEFGDVDNPPTGDINTDRERDWFAVELEARARYRIDMEGVDAALARPRIFGVYDESGDQVDHITGFRGERFAVLDIEVPTAGTYYIVLGRVAGSSSSGRYRLSVTKTDDYPADIRTAGTVEVGGFATGEIETRGDVDWFKVELLAGTYDIDVLGSTEIAGALRDPYLVGIHDSGGNLIENTTNNNFSTTNKNSRVLFDASTGGIYYIAVRSADGGTGTYRVNVSRTIVDDDYADDTSTTGTVAVGGFATGRIEAEKEEDWFAVELLAGVEYRIDLRGSHTLAGTLPDPLLVGVWHGATELDGSENDDGGEGLDSRLSNFRVEADGTYYIAVSNSDPFTGTYRLSVTAVGFGVVKHTATDIAVDLPVPGDIGQSAERDWFKIDLVGGGRYWIDIEGANTNAGTLRDPYLQGIYKPNGTKIPGTEKNDGGVGYNTRFLFAPEEDGTYYIATASNAHYTGTYRLTVTAGAGASDDYPATTKTTGVVAVDGVVTGEITYDGDRDWFAVTLEANEPYRIQLKGKSTNSGTLWDPQIHGVYDSSGNPIENTSDKNSGTGADSKVIFTPGNAGIYYIAAGHANTALNHTGTYLLSVTKTDDYPGAGRIGSNDSDDVYTDFNTTGRVAVGGPTTGNLEQEWDQDWFQVTLQQGKTYRIHVKGADTGDGTLADPYIHRLYELSPLIGNNHTSPLTLGSRYQDNDGGVGRNSQLDFTPDRGGAYAISVQAWGSRDTGTYTVEVEEVM